MDYPTKSELLELLPYLTQQERDELDRLITDPGAVDLDYWPSRARGLFPRYLWHEFSPPHEDLWNWADAIEPDTCPDPFVAIWARGRGKSTHAEAIACDLGARGKRIYCLYVSGTQDQADKHVATIKAMLESADVTLFFPEVGTPLMGKNGSKQWNRNIVTTSNGYTVEAVGLNKAVRGQKIDWARPNLIIFDDVDERHDTEATVKKKREIITTSILPAGAANCAVLFVQNLIHADSIAHQLSKRPGEDGAADWLTKRVVSGPHEAVEGLQYELVNLDDGGIKWSITGGESKWLGYDLSICEEEINRYGPTSFEVESQHNIDADNPDALLSSEIFDATRVSSHPDLVRIAVGVDPAGGAGRCGIVAGGKSKTGGEWHGYTIADASTPYGTPAADWAIAALRCYHAVKADCIVVERNFGGDMASNTIRQAVLLGEDEDGNETVILRGTNVKILEVSASRGKKVRAQPVASVFQLGRAHHVGYFPQLQKQWTT